MVIVTALACSLGGFLLIDAQFRSSLDREVTAVYEENDLLRYTLAQEIQNRPAMDREGLSQAVKNISVSTGRGRVAFRVSDEGGGTVSANGSLPVPAVSLTAGLDSERRGWELAPLQNGRTYLHAASPLVLGGGTLYLENCREVTSLFAAREEQYRSFFYMMLILTAAVGALSLVISGLMVRPLNRLSAAARRMAEGELDVRVEADSEDEVGRLSLDFNAMAAQLERQVQELKDAARRQEDFIGSFAHEIKTPLTSIIGYADLLLSRPATEKQVRESAGYIFREGRRLEALSRKLMDLIVLDKQDFPLRPVPMDAFLQRVGGALRPALEQAGVRLTVTAQAASVPLEPDLMETVCLNLLDNARKAMDRGGDAVLEGFPEPGGYCVQVRDTGKGIPAEELERITEAFYMVDKSRSRAQGGAGLGLAVCQRIVSLHGGTMEFESAVGSGTRVRVHLKGGEA